MKTTLQPQLSKFSEVMDEFTSIPFEERDTLLLELLTQNELEEAEVEEPDESTNQLNLMVLLALGSVVALLKVVTSNGVWHTLKDLVVALLGKGSETGTEGHVAYGPVTYGSPSTVNFTESTFQHLGKSANNPMSIKQFNDRWKGSYEKPFTNSMGLGFVHFQTPEYGVRAGMVLIRNYKKLHNTETIRDFVRVYVTAEDGNNMEQYMSNLEKWTGIHRDQPIDLHDKKTLIALTQAVALQESSSKISLQDLEKIYDAEWGSTKSTTASVVAPQALEPIPTAQELSDKAKESKANQQTGNQPKDKELPLVIIDQYNYTPESYIKQETNSNMDPLSKSLNKLIQVFDPHTTTTTNKTQTTIRSTHNKQ